MKEKGKKKLIAHLSRNERQSTSYFLILLIAKRKKEKKKKKKQREKNLDIMYKHKRRVTLENDKMLPSNKLHAYLARITFSFRGN